VGDPVNLVDPSGRAPWCISDEDDDEVETITCYYTDSGPGGSGQNLGSGKFTSKYPKCNPSNDRGVENELVFALVNYKTAAYATGVADNLYGTNIDGSDYQGTVLLAWAGEESGWGAVSRASQNDNFFSEKGSVGWLFQGACPGTPTPGYACFPSFANSAFSALFSTFSDNYTAVSGASAGLTVTSPTAAFILADQLASGASLAAAFQQIGSGNGPSGGWNPGVSSYGSSVANAINGLQSHLECLEQNYLSAFVR
jgi:hypothetical protein